MRISWIRISDWRLIVFHFSIENWEEQLKKAPCTSFLHVSTLCLCVIFYYNFVKQLVISKTDTIIVIVWLQCYQNPSPAISQRSELGQLAANNLQGPVPKLSSTALFCCKKESKSEKSPSPVWLSTTLISSSS